MNHFATLFDSNYLSRGLCLYSSIKTHCSTPFTFYVVALDERVISYFSNASLNNVVVIPLQKIESTFPELDIAKNNRSRVEYIFTLSPIVPLYILNNFPEVQQITTMDADLFFFDDPNIILKKYSTASVLITPHDFSEELKSLDVYGNYNVSFQSFKRDETGINCLEIWRHNCLEWCGDQYDEKGKRFADQKYLDTWSSDFKNVAAITLPGAGRALWNLKKYTYRSDGDKIFVNDEPLIYYHFHHLRIFNRNFAISGFELYRVNDISRELKVIYHRYLTKLNQLSMAHLSNNIQRYRPVSGSMLSKLFSLKGYWVFSKYFIFYLRPQKPIERLKGIKKRLWPNL